MIIFSSATAEIRTEVAAPYFCFVNDFLRVFRVRVEGVAGEVNELDGVLELCGCVSGAFLGLL